MLRLTTAGESHGPGLTAILEGIPAGVPLTVDDIAPDLIRRQHGRLEGGAYRGASPRMAIEHDQARILGGVMEGRTTGAPIALFIENSDHAKWKGKAVPAMTIPRPGHADWTAALKFGYDDLRPGLERSSARETAARVAACAVCRKLLAELGIRIGSYVVQIGSVRADVSPLPMEDRLRLAEESALRCPVPDAAAEMQSVIDRAMKAGDTAGGVFELAAIGLPPGLGTNASWDGRLSSRLGAALLGIPAIKGVEFGGGFGLAALPGTQAQDAFRREGDRIIRPTNHAGGLEGGITNGEPLIVRAVMKPIATTITTQPSVDLASGGETDARYERSDFCPVPRAAIVGEAMVCLVLAGAVLEKCGGDSLAEIRGRFDRLPRGRVQDAPLRTEPKTFWE
jgi:chorismate synthase